MKIKIIDLLNKIANNEDVPKKIKWQGQIYEYSYSNRFYYQNSWSMYRYFYKEGNCLNDEVEIIEEDKKIKRLKKHITDNACATIDQRAMANKINELIDAVNELKRNK